MIGSLKWFLLLSLLMALMLLIFSCQFFRNAMTAFSKFFHHCFSPFLFGGVGRRHFALTAGDILMIGISSNGLLYLIFSPNGVFDLSFLGDNNFYSSLLLLDFFVMLDSSCHCLDCWLLPSA